MWRFELYDAFELLKSMFYNVCYEFGIANNLTGLTFTRHWFEA